MPTVTETDLKEIKDLITSGFSRLDAEITSLKINQAQISGQINAIDEKLTGKINALDEKLSGQINAVDEKLSGQIHAVDEKLSGKINALDEKVTGFGKRLENQEFTNRGILIALVVALIAGAAKLFGWLPNP